MEILLRRGQFINKGAEAMLKTASRELSGRLGTVTMTLPPDAIYSGTAPLAEAAGFRLMPAGPQSRAERLSAGRRIACHPFLAGRRMIDPLWREAVTRLQGLAAVVDVAGFAYGDTWPVKHIARTRAYVGAARFLGIPHVFLPQAWGPFELQRRRPIFRQMCTDTTTAYARDRTSFEGLSRLMRNTGSACDIRLAPDIAFRFKGASPQVGRQLLEASGVPSSSEPLVAVVPNWKVYERSRGIGLENRYVQALCDICRDLRRAGTTVVLIPHEISQSELGTVDDRLLCGLVTAGVSDPRVVFMNGRYSAEEIKAVIGNCRMLVGSRFHALVAALSQGIPVGAIGWSHKYHELLKEFGLSEFVTDFESLARSSIRELVHLLLREQDSLADVVGAKLPEIFRQVDAVFDDLAGTIAGNGVRQAA